jgi:hypothetical protein
MLLPTDPCIVTEMHKQLRSSFSGAKSLPFPPKVVNRKQPRIIEGRRVLLEGYLRDVVYSMSKNPNSQLYQEVCTETFLSCLPQLKQDL